MSSTADTFDLICVGSGMGGCAAAIAAAEAGLQVALVEKADTVGGTSAWSFGIVWVGANHLAAEGGIADEPDDTRAYLDYLGGGRNDPEVTDSFVRHAPTALRFYAERAGVPFYVVDGLPDHYYPIGAGSKERGRSLQVRPFQASCLGPWQDRLEFTPFGHGRLTFEEVAAAGGRAGSLRAGRSLAAEREAEDVRTWGCGLAGYFFRSVLDHGVTVHTGLRADRLVVEGGRVTGIEVERAGERQVLSARRGVVLATGMYDSNPRLMGWFDEFPMWPTRASSRNQGDGFVMAAEHGSAFTVMHWNLSVKPGYHVPGEMRDGQPLARLASTQLATFPHSMLVNRSGHRFADESTFGDVAAKLRLFDAFAHQLVNVPCYLVFDARFWRQYGMPPCPPGSEPPAWLPHADTVRGLADRLGIDAAGLEATVARLNRFAADGVDADFGRGRIPFGQRIAGDLAARNPNLGSIEEPPFFGLEMLVKSGNTVGLVTNGSGQVIHLRGHAIPGLYACGEVVAWMHAGVGYQAGLSLAGGMTFGWLAAQHAASRSLGA